MKIGIVGVGHAFVNQYKALKSLGFELIICDHDPIKLKPYDCKSVTDYHNLVGAVDAVLISTPPNTHFDIIKYFLEKKVFVISEKPLVTSLNELEYLENIIDNNFYNILHFSFGDEIEWFLKSNLNKGKPNRIVSYINDPYIVNKHIKEEAINLHGAYLDETINPLSAIYRIYGNDILYQDSKCKFYENDLYDYSSEANFKVSNIPVNIKVNWNDRGDKSKYIDLYFDDFTIRLDSLNASVINLTTGETLFKSNELRMFKHYVNGFKHFMNNKTNIHESLAINREILKYQL